MPSTIRQTIRTTGRTLSANSVAILGVLMGVIGFFASLYPPTSGSCGQALLAAIFAVLVAVTLLAILVPEYQKAALNDPETIMMRAFGLVAEIIRFTNTQRLTAMDAVKKYDLYMGNPYDLYMERFNREFQEQYTLIYGSQIQTLLDALRTNGVVLPYPGDVYLRPDDPTKASTRIVDLANAGYQLGIKKT